MNTVTNSLIMQKNILQTRQCELIIDKTKYEQSKELYMPIYHIFFIMLPPQVFSLIIHSNYLCIDKFGI